MLSFVIVLGLTALLGAAIATSTPTPTPTLTSTATTIPSIHTQIRVQTFKQENCGGAYEFLWLDPNVCIEFAAGAMSMRVVGSDGEVGWDARMFLFPSISQKKTPLYGSRCKIMQSRDLEFIFSFGNGEALGGLNGAC
jgi:hypothetical protein